MNDALRKRIEIPEDARIHLGEELRIEQGIDFRTVDPAVFRRLDPDSGALSAADQHIASTVPGSLAARRLGYRLETTSEHVMLARQGLVTSYGLFGAPGSGKTHLFLYILRQLLGYRAKMPDLKYGGLILDPKASLLPVLRDIMRKEDVGRRDDLIVINAEDLEANSRRVNLIDCAVDDYALGDLLVLSARAAGTSVTENFWFLEWANLFSAALVVLRYFDSPDIGSYKGDVVTLRKLIDACLLERDGPRGPKRSIEHLAADARSRLSEVPKERRPEVEAATNQIERFFRAPILAE